MLDDRVSALISRIYGDARDFSTWDRVLDDILALTDSRFIMLSAVDLANGDYSQARFYGPDDARFLNAVDDYQDHVHQTDTLLAFGMRHPHAGFASLRMAVAATGLDYDHHPYTHLALDHLCCGDSIVCYTPAHDGLTLGVSLHPSVARGTHDERDIRLFRTLFDHIEQSVKLAARPPDLIGDAEATVLLDRRGHIVAVSRRADRLLARADGLSAAGGRLFAAARIANDGLRRAVASALGTLTEGGTGGALAVARPSGLRPFAVTVSPFFGVQGPFAPFLPAVLVRIVDPDDGPQPDAAASWKSIYGLTPAEARLAEAVVRGDGSIRQVADALGIAYSTARVHLANLFEKTETGSQSQLVRLLSRIGVCAAGTVAGYAMLVGEAAAAI